MADEIHGRELVVGEVFGYACPTHGLRYYRRGEKGRLELCGIADTVQLDPDVPVCPRCLSPLGSPLPEGDAVGEILVPAHALAELQWMAWAHPCDAVRRSRAEYLERERDARGGRHEGRF